MFLSSADAGVTDYVHVPYQLSIKLSASQPFAHLVCFACALIASRHISVVALPEDFSEEAEFKKVVCIIYVFSIRSIVLLLTCLSISCQCC